MENIWLIGIAALVVGALIGYLMGRSGGGNSQAALAEQLNDARTELENYKQDVAKHFEGTAELVNNLTNSYKDVHQHLADGAQNLCQSEAMTINLASAMQPKLENETTAETPDTETEKPAEEETAPKAETSESTEAPEKPETPEPPRDYAPKSPDEEGTLSESFGLKDDEKTEETLEQPTPDNPDVRKEKAE